jgi:hypothetical protein
MKVYIICFDDSGIAYPKVFLDRERAEGRLKSIQEEVDALAAKRKQATYSHFYSVEEMEVED